MAIHHLLRCDCAIFFLVQTKFKYDVVVSAPVVDDSLSQPAGISHSMGGP